MSENKQDTITVELPIEADGPEYVNVDHVALATRERWREIAADPAGADTSALTAHVAPAVVAWIERDEWEPLPIPEAGRTIRATLRNGREVEGEVRQVEDMGAYVAVLMGGYGFAIDTSPKAHPDPSDIIAWHYVDEPAESEPGATHAVTVSLQVDLSGFADSLQAAADAIREVTK